MENLTVCLPKTTIELLTVLSKKNNEPISSILEDMAMERYMKDRVSLKHSAVVLSSTTAEIDGAFKA